MLTHLERFTSCNILSNSLQLLALKTQTLHDWLTEPLLKMLSHPKRRVSVSISCNNVCQGVSMCVVLRFNSNQMITNISIILSCSLLRFYSNAIFAAPTQRKGMSDQMVLIVQHHIVGHTAGQHQEIQCHHSDRMSLCTTDVTTRPEWPQVATQWFSKFKS